MNNIKFKYTNAPYGFFSNFSPHPVVYNNKNYKTTENLYQALKFTNEAIHDTIRTAPTAKDAAYLGRTSTGMRRDWDDVKLDTMRMIIRLKIEQHPFIKDELLRTGEAEIIEDSNKDLFWGQNIQGNGYNWLGKLWMELREQLRKATN